MDLPLAFGIFVLGATLGGVLVFGWMSDRKPLIEQFRELPDTAETRARGGL